MTHNELIDVMVRTITIERAATRVRLASGTPTKNRFILSGLTGDQLDAVERYIASFKLNS